MTLIESPDDDPHISISPTSIGIVSVVLAFALGLGVIPMGLSALLKGHFLYWPTAVRVLIPAGASLFTWLLIFIRLFQQNGTDFARQIGITSNKKPVYLIGMGLCSGILIFLLGLALGLASQYFHWPQSLPYQHLKPDQLNIVLILAIVCAPFFEELVFRGLLQSTLYRYMSPLMSVMLTALCFVGFHTMYYGNWMALGYLLTLSLILGWLRNQTGSILPGIIGHMANNVMAAFLVLN